MDIWGWIAVYAVGLTVLQLLVYRYLVGGRSGSSASRSSTLAGDEYGWLDEEGQSAGGRRWQPNDGPDVADRPRTSSPTVSAPEPRRRVETADGRYCPHCGAENESDAVFDRCWNCAAQL